MARNRKHHAMSIDDNDYIPSGKRAAKSKTYSRQHLGSLSDSNRKANRVTYKAAKSMNWEAPAQPTQQRAAPSTYRPILPRPPSGLTQQVSPSPSASPPARKDHPSSTSPSDKGKAKDDNDPEPETTSVNLEAYAAAADDDNSPPGTTSTYDDPAVGLKVLSENMTDAANHLKKTLNSQNDSLIVFDGVASTVKHWSDRLTALVLRLEHMETQRVVDAVLAIDRDEALVASHQAQLALQDATHRTRLRNLKEELVATYRDALDQQGEAAQRECSDVLARQRERHEKELAAERARADWDRDVQGWKARQRERMEKEVERRADAELAQRLSDRQEEEEEEVEKEVEAKLEAGLAKQASGAQKPVSRKRQRSQMERGL